MSSSTELGAATAIPGVAQTLRVDKSTTMGIGAPEGFFTRIYRVEQNDNAQDVGTLTNITSKQWWTKQKFFLPPNFELGVTSDPGAHFGRPQRRREPQPDTPPPTPPTGLITKVARIRYRRFEGLFGCQAIIATRFNDNPYPKLWTIRRKAERRYSLGSLGNVMLEWRGTHRALNILPDYMYNAPHCNGNLKLVATTKGAPTSLAENQTETTERILAVWQNRTDARILESLIIFDTAQDIDVINVEEILASCLCIVLAERMTLRGWLGGIGREGVDILGR